MIVVNTVMAVFKVEMAIQIKRMRIVVTKMCGEEDESDDIFSRLSDPQRDN